MMTHEIRSNPLVKQEALLTVHHTHNDIPPTVASATFSTFKHCNTIILCKFKLKL